MGTIRRRKHTERTGRVTPAAVAAFRAGDKAALHAELRLRPWQASPIAAVGACPWPASCAGAVAWPQSVALREVLEASL